MSGFIDAVKNASTYLKGRVRTSEKYMAAVTALFEQYPSLALVGSLEDQKSLFLSFSELEPEQQGKIGLTIARGDFARLSSAESKCSISDSEREISPSFCWIGDLVQCESSGTDLSVANFFAQWADSFFYCDTLDESLELQRYRVENGAPDIVILTQQGECVYPWGVSIRGEVRNKASLEAELRSLLAEIERLESKESSLGEVIQQANDRMTELVSEREGLRDELVNRRLTKEREAQSILRDILEARSEKFAQLKTAERLFARLEEENSRINDEMKSLAEKRAELIRLREHAESERKDQLSLFGQDDESQRKNKSILNALHAEISICESKRNEVASRLGELSESLEDTRRRRSTLSDKRMRIEVERERFNVELRMLSEDADNWRQDGEELPSTAECIECWRTTEDPESKLQVLISRVAEARQKLGEHGEVDEEAVSRFEIEKERLEALTSQLDDLSEAAKKLRSTIQQLKEISRVRFLETFNSVQEKFSKLVPRLFGGGAGHLTLINPEDPLTSGVELSVRPPGKKLKSMELLSGGEKALTATALLFAMFLHRPSPICVLDEVDAPLDDANLERFLQLIRQISIDTQCLIITHNKSSMASVDRLLGITMQESGVSTALSVSFEQAEAVLEQ